MSLEDKVFYRKATLTITDHNESTGVIKGINDLGAEIIMTTRQLHNIYHTKSNWEGDNGITTKVVDIAVTKTSEGLDHG